MSEIVFEELKDIREIKIDENKNLDERIKSYIKQIGNPYCFKYKNIKVSIGFVGEESLEDRLVSFLKSKIN